jgi:ketosteroid isomerase-like protein
MDNLSCFMKYAADFEKTFADDDWARLRQYFADDAVYEVKSDGFPCALTGTDAIFKGIKKSLDGFDRKFEGRELAVTKGPEVDGDTVRLAWAVTYRKAGKAPYVLRGRTEARYRAGKIAYMSDSYDASVGSEAAAWMQQNGMILDPSYV